LHSVKINNPIGIDLTIVGFTTMQRKGSKFKSMILCGKKANVLAGALGDERNLRIKNFEQPKSPAPRVNHNQLGHQRPTAIHV
jgi:hypothetical protein